MSTRAALALLGITLSACNADLTMPWEIEGPHIYGSRIEVVGDSDRAMPAFGESFILHQYMVGAEELTEPFDQRFDMKLAVCVGLQAPNGALVCAQGFDLETKSTVVSGTELVTEPIIVPPLDGLLPNLPPEVQEFIGEINQVAIVGAVCVQGTAERVAGTTLEENAPSELFRCNSRPESIYKAPLAFQTTVWLDNGGGIKASADGGIEPLADGGTEEVTTTPNHNPSFACDPGAPMSPCNAGVIHEPESIVAGPIVLVGPADPKKPKETPRGVQAWNPYPSAELPRTNCAGDPGLPQVRVGSGEHLIRVRLDPSDREDYKYQAEEYGRIVIKDARELIQVSHSLTAFGGELARYTSVVERDDDDAMAETEVAYTPPKKNPGDEGAVPESGRLVRFYFALRDFRGGFDFVARELCLLPKATDLAD
jgi:hypothetical protein